MCVWGWGGVAEQRTCFAERSLSSAAALVRGGSGGDVQPCGRAAVTAAVPDLARGFSAAAVPLPAARRRVVAWCAPCARPRSRTPGRRVAEPPSRPPTAPFHFFSGKKRTKLPRATGREKFRLCLKTTRRASRRV